MILQLVPENDPLLTTKLEPYDFSNTTSEENLQIANDLIDTLTHHKALGLAANQVGLTHRVFVMKGEVPLVCFNPKIVSVSSDLISLEEGCLSYPNLLVKIKRPRSIRVRFQDYKGEIFTRQFTNLTARIFQHEYDHLEGKIFYNRANRFHKEQALKNRKKPVKPRDMLGEYREFI